MEHDSIFDSAGGSIGGLQVRDGNISTSSNQNPLEAERIAANLYFSSAMHYSNFRLTSGKVFFIDLKSSVLLSRVSLIRSTGKEPGDIPKRLARPSIYLATFNLEE